MRFKTLGPFIFVALALVAYAPPPAAQEKTPPAAQEKPPEKSKVDLGAFTQEIMNLKMEGDKTQLALWFPHEFFIQAQLNDGNTTRGQAEQDLALLKPYHAVIVQCSIDKGNGKSDYAGQKDVAARAVLKLADGTEIAPVQNVPITVSLVVTAMKSFLSAEGDEGGANMHVLIFPAQTKEGKTIVDTAKKGKLTLVLKADKQFPETTFAWHTPFDATTPAAPCPKCKERVSAKWSFCPWCGAGLEKK
ncbi:MAG: zinc ribbon domain-containing protein [Planctomycetia bacterium]|nr:zinc ribbon domain-containing protein [Planctomycetia bacterium]